MALAPLLPARGFSPVVHAELAHLAGQRVAAPAQELGGLLLHALGLAQRDPDQDPLHLGYRAIEQPTRTGVELALGPVGERRGPLGRRAVGIGRRTAEIRRDVLDADLAAGRGHGEPAARVHQLADVAGPCEGDQCSPCRRSQRLRVDPELCRGARQIVFEQLRDVLAPFAQRRDLDPDHVEPMQQIFAEQPGPDTRFEILMGRRDHAHVHAHRDLAADAVELALGEHPQQPGLQRRRHVADLVEEQRATVGLLEAATAQRIRAGERALLVPEQFALEQIGRERRGIQRDERLGGPRAMPMQGARDEFLPGARFTGDQHRHAGTRQPADRTEDLLHARRVTEQLRHRPAGRLALAVDRERRVTRRAADQFDRLVDVERLRQVLERASLVRGNRRVEVRMRGHHDHRQARPRGTDLLQQFEAAATRHPDVGHQHVRRRGAQRGEHGRRAVERTSEHSARLQRLLEHPADRCIVVDEPYAQGLRVHAVSIGSDNVKTVRPGALSNSIKPPWRVTRSCATARPKPDPPSRPETRG